MRKLALTTTALPLLLGLATVAQAGVQPGVPCGTDESAVLECKATKKGRFEVFSFSNDGGNVQADISVGDDCSEALDFLSSNDSSSGDGEGNGFFVDEVSTGTPDRTVYTMRAFGNDCK